MRKGIGIGSFGAMAIVALFLLSNIPMAGAAYAPDTTVPLMAGQNTAVGTVHVSHDISNFYVEYKITVAGWEITQTHLAFSVDTTPESGGCDISQIPHNKPGNPIPGQFKYSDSYNPATTSAKYTVPFADIGFVFGEEICIAAHAVVQQKVNGIITQQQTGWGQGEQFPGKNWAMYFCYVPTPYKTLPAVPGGLWQFKATYIYPNTGAKSYWSMDFTPNDPFPGDPEGYIYSSWCVDNNNKDFLSSGSSYKAYLYSSCDPTSFPTTGEGLARFNVQWGKINYILNHKAGRTTQDIQEAIWWYTNQITPTTVGGNALVTAADANGNVYLIPMGGIFGVILYVPGYYSQPNNYLYQMTIIEVDP